MNNNKKPGHGLRLLCISFLTAVLFLPASAAPTNEQQFNPQQDLHLDSGSLGLKGPFQIGADYSSEFGYLIKSKFDYLLDEMDAIALELNGGDREFRLGATWGRALTDNQRLKFTAERLMQKMDFDFDSGSVSKWVGQNAIGLGYQYLLPKSVVKTVDAGGYYSEAESRGLDNKIFTNSSGTFLNYRHIAGATSKGLNSGVHVQLWSTGLIGTELNYDDVRYHTHYETGDNASGLGGTFTLDQLINDHVKVSLEGSKREIYDLYQAGISWLRPTRPGTQLEFTLSGSHTQGHLGLPNDSRVGINMAYAWGGSADSPPASYSAPNADVAQDLLNWTNEPAVQMAEVLAIRDQKNEQLSSSSVSTQQVVVQANIPISIHVPDYFSQANVTAQYTAENLPEGLNYDAKKSEISGVIPAKDAGKTFVVLLTETSNTTSMQQVSKDIPLEKLTRPLTLIVMQGKLCPQTISEQTRFDDVPLDVAGQDIDVEALGACQANLEYQLSSGPEGVRVKDADDNGWSKTGDLVSDKDVTAGRYSVGLLVRNADHSQTDAPSFSLVVINVAAPTSQAIPDIWGSVDETFNYAAGKAGNFNPGGQGVFKYEFIDNPNWLMIPDPDNQEGVIESDGNVPDTADDSHVTLKGEKYINQQDTTKFTEQSFMIYIKPTVRSTAGTYTLTYDEAHTPINAAADGQFNAHGGLFLTYAFDKKPDGFSMNDAGTITVDQAVPVGEYNFNIIGTKTPPTASGLQPETVSWPVKVTVAPAAPTATDWTDPIWVTVSGDIDVTDTQSHFNAGGGVLTYSLSNAPSWMKINNPTTGEITGSVSSDAQDANAVTVTGTQDGTQTTAAAHFDLKINPTADGDKTLSLYQNEQQTIDATSAQWANFNSHGGSLTDAIKSKPDWVMGTPQALVIAPNDATAPGDYSVVIEATKAAGHVIDWTLVVHVNKKVRHIILSCPATQNGDPKTLSQQDSVGEPHTFSQQTKGRKLAGRNLKDSELSSHDFSCHYEYANDTTSGVEFMTIISTDVENLAHHGNKDPACNYNGSHTDGGCVTYDASE